MDWLAFQRRWGGEWVEVIRGEYRGARGRIWTTGCKYPGDKRQGIIVYLVTLPKPGAVPLLYPEDVRVITREAKAAELARLVRKSMSAFLMYLHEYQRR